jgi:7-cyano-7-deazaguanine synthase
MKHGVVLLSGGFDSVAALFWARARYIELRAISFDYGQPNRDGELTYGHGVANDLGIPRTCLHLADAFRPENPQGLMAGEDAPGPVPVGGTDRAFVPGRNLVLLSVAAAHAATWWPGDVDLIVGASAEDQAGFPDCRPTTFAKLAMTLSAGMGRTFVIRSPWADMTKSQILYAVKPDAVALEAVQRSYSCYRHRGPCGQCGACVKRAVAFVAQGIVDLSEWPKMGGGDPQRMAG